MAIVVRIDRDSMQAFVDVERQGDETIDVDAILRALAEAGVVHGIDPVACKSAVDELLSAPPDQAATYLVARGTPPVTGEDGRVEMDVEFHHSDVGIQRTSGSVDFHERGAYTPIEKGQLIARIIPPGAGTPGKTVRGEETPCTPGKRARLTAGKNTKFEAEGAELRASLTGDLRVVEDRIEVMDVIRVSGNLDFSVGSIECEGPVRVEGDVLPGFHIRAGGDVWIGGIVEKAEVRTRGNLTVAQGVLGGSHIEAVGKIAVGYVREAYMESEGAITIARESVNSTVIGDSISIPQAGRVVGGRLMARSQIEVGTVTHGQGPPTTLAAGVEPLAELKAARLKKAIHSADKHEKRIDRMRSLAGPPFPAILDHLLERAAQKRAGSSGELSDLKRQEPSVETCKIRISREAHPGVHIRIGGSELTIRNDCRVATFYYDPGSGQVVQI